MAHLNYCGYEMLLDSNSPNIVGRSKHAQIQFNDLCVSKTHAEIYKHPGSGNWFIIDSGSLNGTFINGKILTQERELNDGDTIIFGKSLKTTFCTEG